MLYIALVHHPIYNKEKRIVTTSVTNMDIHDLSRTGRTFDVKKYFVVTPSEAQQNMVKYIRDYWQEGHGATYNPDRKEALGILECLPDITECQLTIEKLSGKKPLLIATTAKQWDNAISYSEVQQRLKSDEPVLLIFGTGFGLTDEFLEKVDYILDPIEAASDYNHLPVRSAVAIILDRLVGR